MGTGKVLTEVLTISSRHRSEATGESTGDEFAPLVLLCRVNQVSISICTEVVSIASSMKNVYETM